MLNNIILQGRLTAAPELRRTQDGKAVVSFGLAVERDFNRTQTDFFDIVCWSRTAEFVSNYFGKGDLILVNGRLQTRAWTDKVGNKRTSYEIVASQVWFCGGRAKSQNNDFPVTADDEILPWDMEE